MTAKRREYYKNNCFNLGQDQIMECVTLFVF